MKAQELLHQDDSDRDFLKSADWDYAQDQLDEGQPEQLVLARLRSWVRDEQRIQWCEDRDIARLHDDQ